MVGPLIPLACAGLVGLLAACGTSSGAKPSAVASGTPATQSPPGTTPGSGPIATPGGPPAADVSSAGDIPDTQKYIAYMHPSGAFTVKVPEGWARSETGDAVLFTDHANSIRLESQPAAVAPTVASVQSSELPAVQQQSRNFAAGKVSEVSRPGGAAVLATYQTDSAPDPVTGKSLRLAAERYEFWRNGLEAVITVFGAAGGDYVDPWRTVTESFQWR